MRITNLMNYPQIDPVLLHLGPIQIRWYGLMYVIGFVVAYFVILRIIRLRKEDLTRQDVEDGLAYCILGLIIGARLGYCLFYNFDFYLHNPLKIFAVWQGGMSFHGGLIGVCLAGWLFTLQRKISFWLAADLGAIAAPPGLFFGRLGNFINAELYGRVTDVPWGMVFPGGGPDPRHPSQLYEAFLEGFVIFLIMYVLGTRIRTHGHLLALFLLLYGIFRFILEFFREPDPQLGFVLGSFSMGQILCFGMIIFGIGLFLRLKSTAK